MKAKPIRLFFLVYFLVVITFAQTGKPDHHRRNPKMQAELKTYLEAKVVPTMQQQRLKLEKQLSSADKKQIRELRIQIAAVRKQAQSLRENTRLQRNAGNRHLTEEQKTHWQNQREENLKIRAKARMLAHKYNAQIQALYKEVAAPAEAWRQDIANITQKYQKNKPAESNLKYSHRPHNRWVKDQPAGEYFRPVAFLLWDVNKPLVTDGADPEITHRFYPNPVTTRATLQYTVKEKSPVNIVLLDEQGKIIRQLAKTTQGPGNYDLHLNLDDLKKGIYYYQITTGSGTQTNKIIKN